MFGGLMPAMVTPFDERGEVDFGATEAVIERFIEAGVSGISPLGSTGEASHLTADERKLFAEEIVRIVGGRVPLVVGVGATGTRESSSSRPSTGRSGRKVSSNTSRPWRSRSTSRSWSTTSRC